MLRAAVWTCGLFVVGGGIVQFVPGRFTEPLVLLALGATLFLVGGRNAAAARTDTSASDPDTVAPTRAARWR